MWRGRLLWEDMVVVMLEESGDVVVPLLSGCDLRKRLLRCRKGEVWLCLPCMHTCR